LLDCFNDVFHEKLIIDYNIDGMMGTNPGTSTTTVPIRADDHFALLVKDRVHGIRFLANSPTRAILVVYDRHIMHARNFSGDVRRPRFG